MTLHMAAYDLNKAKQSISALASNVKVVSAYTNVVGNLALGPQPIYLDGELVQNYDPLSAYPAIEDALRVAQGHCNGFNGFVIEYLHIYPVLQRRSYATIQAGLGRVAAMLNELVSSNSNPTPQQTQTILAALKSASDAITQVQEVPNRVQQEIGTFFQQTPGDRAALTSGSTDLADALPTLENNLIQDVTTYPMFGKMFQDIGGKMLNALGSLTTQVNIALASGRATSLAIENLQDVLTASALKAVNVLGALQQANADQYTPILQQLDVTNAQSFWADYTAYLATSGLG